MTKLSPYKQGFLGGIVAFCVVAVFFVASTALAQDGDYDPTKDIDNNGQIDVLDIQSVAGAWNTAGSPRAPLVVFATSSTYQGNGPATYGRRGMHQACHDEDPAAHFCSIQEIENALRTTGVYFDSGAQAWVDNMILGTLADGYDGDVTGNSDWYGGSGTGDYPYNCQGWINSANAARGIILNTGTISPATEACDDTHPIACCK
jgi:hypothetical protein